eukprot:g21759.t1
MAPVSTQLMRHLSLTVIAQRDWKLESLDLKTAFLQTGVRILRNVYGNADAPRELWRDVDTKLKSIGAHRLIGDSSFWIWVEENPNPINEADQFRLIGFVGGHVDDFMRAGDLSNDTWLKVRKDIDELYAWGSKKEENFRYTGLNVEVVNKNKERYVELNQDFYLEDLPPLAISDERLRLDPKTSLTDGEMAACRASLGALQWTATQTQIQACARVNLLLTELTVNKNMAVAVEINQLIKDLKKDPMQIRLAVAQEGEGGLAPKEGAGMSIVGQEFWIVAVGCAKGQESEKKEALLSQLKKHPTLRGSAASLQEKREEIWKRRFLQVVEET